MSRSLVSIPASYFDQLYAKHLDPWNFSTSRYELGKYQATLAALTRSRYKSALEVGCSIGVLTAKLALRCAHLDALDVADSALDQARAFCTGLKNVLFHKARVPAEWPQDQYDLFILSEVLYYLDRADLKALASRIDTSALAGAEIILVHWLGETDYPLSGDDAADEFIQMSAGFARILRQTRTENYRLDLLRVVSDRGAGAD